MRFSPYFRISFSHFPAISISWFSPSNDHKRNLRLDLVYIFPLTLNLVILSYNRLLDHLENFEEDWKNEWPALPEAARCGWAKLKGYYCKAEGHAFAVATAMDPRLKFQWWEDKNWGHFGDVAKEQVQATWEAYKPIAGHKSSICNPDALIRRPQRIADQLQAYVSANCIFDETNGVNQELVLSYWRGEVNEWKELKTMARRYIPASRNRLNPAKLRESVLANSWCTYFGE